MMLKVTLSMEILLNMFTLEIPKISPKNLIIYKKGSNAYNIRFVNF